MNDSGANLGNLPQLERDGITAIGTYPFPGPEALVPGSDGAGIAEEVGEGVSEWKPGDRALANFTQDHIAGRLTPKTLLSQLGGEIQGLLGEYFNFSSDWNCQTVLLQGTGGVSMFGLQIAHAAGA
ncbi:uncharacterized protein N7469_011612 [Penicillium citrinum]|uniref:Alcohol dehydrogenase-like N-terminal domain-containing protein n=1 Tax=Penicillium citrinum TaxID=5077 RepID=A0A9W9NBE2_PENCI|nr:uncharacterized protein N7469_011612 [Penicillium citrinum]KAJ5216747.1 hypothetical protein N7469_011612 [Penicillium citrinum]